MTVGDSVGNELTGGGCQKGLCVVTQVAALHIVLHIAAHPWPPKVMGDELGHFPPSRVACHWVIVVGLHDVEPELTVVRDIDFSSIVY